MMPNGRPISQDLFDLLCIRAKSKQPINLATAGLWATYEQAKTLLELMDATGLLTVNNEGYDGCEMMTLGLLGCKFVANK